jgi:hypothetical protein
MKKVKKTGIKYKRELYSAHIQRELGQSSKLYSSPRRKSPTKKVEEPGTPVLPPSGNRALSSSRRSKEFIINKRGSNSSLSFSGAQV